MFMAMSLPSINMNIKNSNYLNITHYNNLIKMKPDIYELLCNLEILWMKWISKFPSQSEMASDDQSYCDEYATTTIVSFCSITESYFFIASGHLNTL